MPVYFSEALVESGERLKKYVQENDIVDIKFDKNGLAAAFGDDNEDDEEYERAHPPVELDNAAFLDITGSFDSNEDNSDKVANVNDAVKDIAQVDKLFLLQKQHHLQKSQLRRSTFCLKLSKGRFPIH
jgi:hypothetical protein